jgi:hypothetical protein
LSKDIKKKVPDLMQEALDTYKERNAVYGDTYKRHGHVMKELFHNGVNLSSIDDQNRYAIITMIVSKLCRYSNNFNTGGHSDSMHDISVYSFMLSELDQELK